MDEREPLLANLGRVQSRDLVEGRASPQCVFVLAMPLPLPLPPALLRTLCGEW